jgi:hypothetical protein
MLILKHGYYNITRLTDNETFVNVSSIFKSDPVFRIVIPSIASTYLLTNFICVIIFSNQDFKEDMYHYLKFKSISIILHSLIQILRPISNLRVYFSSASLVSVIYDLYFLSYLVSCLELCIILFHILSTLDYYLIVTNKTDYLKLTRKLSYRIKILFVFLFSIFIYLQELFSRIIKGWTLIEINQTNIIADQRTYYSIQTTSFSSLMTKKIISNIVFLIRDCLNLIILIVLNILIYVNVIKSIKKKRIIFLKSNKVDDISKNNSTYSSNSTTTSRLSKIDKTERKVTFMVIFSSLTYISSRIPLLIIVLASEYSGVGLWGTTFGLFTTVYLYVTYLIDILYYYLFNERFRKILNGYIFQILKKA